MNMKLRERLAGLGLIGWIVAVPLALIFLLILVIGFYEGRKVYWDHKVTKMCEEDGGVTVYEKVTLTQQEYEKYGGIKGSISLSSKELRKVENPYFTENTTKIIRKSKPKVYRSEYLVKRRDDERILARYVDYSRVGGDFFALHPSSFGCPNHNFSLSKQIFIIEGEQ